MKKYTLYPALLLAGVLAAQSAGAATYIPSFDSRSETDGVPAPTNGSTTDLGVGPLSAGRSFRSYLTFDLTALTLADTATSATLNLFNIGAEANTSALPQVFSLFQTAVDWNGGPGAGPLGTTLATLNVTPAVGTDTQNFSFNSPALTAAFNVAIGGTLYLGIMTDLENVDNRSFVFFGSLEDAALNKAPALVTVGVPEPTTLALSVLAGGLLVARRRSSK